MTLADYIQELISLIDEKQEGVTALELFTPTRAQRTVTEIRHKLTDDHKAATLGYLNVSCPK